MDKKVKSIDLLIKEALLTSPLPGASVNSPFGPRWGKFHNGVDLQANLDNVKTPLDGIITKAEFKNDGCGGTIIIKHPDGFETGYCHMSKINVRSGDKVKKGDVIGISGGGKNDYGRGNSLGRHLHFTLRKNGQSVDPMKYIDKINVSTSEFQPSDIQKTGKDEIDWDALFNGKISADTMKKISNKTNDPLLASILSNLDFSSILKKEMKEMTLPLTEEFKLNGAKKVSSYEYEFNDGTAIYPILAGEVELADKTNSCDEELRIEHQIRNEIFYTKYCNIKKLKVRKDNKVSPGKLLGYASYRTNVKLLDRYGSEIKWSVLDPLFTKKTDDKGEGDKGEDRNKNKPLKSGDPLLNLILSPLANAKVLDNTEIKSPSSKEAENIQPYKWVDFLKKNSPSRVNENIQKIKRLLK